MARWISIEGDIRLGKEMTNFKFAERLEEFLESLGEGFKFLGHIKNSIITDEDYE
jgi:predicted nuclease of restriction endonuclease-like (RecB) superfamily